MESIFKVRNRKLRKEGIVTFKCMELGSENGPGFYTMFVNNRCVAMCHSSPHTPRERSLESGPIIIPENSEISVVIEGVSYSNPVIGVR